MSNETYWDKHGIPRVTLSEAIWQITVSVERRQNRGVWFLISEAGEGKSQSINRVLRQHGYRICDIRTAQLTHIGAGVPERPVDGFFNYAVPNDMPHPGEKAAVVFDEFNQGQPHAIALAFKLLEDRSIYGYQLPDDCPIILAGNPSTARYMVSKIETNAALNRRVKKLYVYTTFAEWKAHAQTDEFHYTDGLSKPCHPAVVRFLTASPELLYTVKDRDGSKQFCCPATWQTVSLDLYNMEEVGESLTSSRTENRVASTINTVNAMTLTNWIRNNEILVSPIDVLNNYTKDSGIRKKVKKMQGEPGGGYPRLIEATATYIFTDQPAPGKIASRLALFWNDMPSEQAMAFYSQLNAASKSDPDTTDKNIEYMKDLTRALSDQPEFENMRTRLERDRISASDEINGNPTSRDPLNP